MTDTAQTIALLLETAAAQQKLAEAALEMARDLQRQTQEHQWVKLTEAALMLGSAFTAGKIGDDIKAGLFKYGRDYINTSNGVKPNYAVKVARLRKVYELEPEKRPTYPQPEPAQKEA
ncbi:hypothetical protein [Pseudanabaena sp. FACHB-2040]|uniref:hypothetical protein n=1 Tax=Pseudanabaena sp. FACHB-2040 TaxID=2692859 RepID=UPI0016870D45|nr:hypothetical protein [Pseudanabaena sp. FACHB-2040]MBD2261413.1 hypothetical protein [Pseudanabaena sp. FACHB-2040]